MIKIICFQKDDDDKNNNININNNYKCWNFRRQKHDQERNREDPEILRTYNRNRLRVECKNKSDTSIIGENGTVSEPFRQYLSNIEGKHEIKGLR